jgi:SAM-dependent methyltransferase
MTQTPPGRYFGQAAEAYDRYRPGYPAAAVTWALGEQPRRIADLGAGTGILSRQLHQLGHDVIAVEPDEQMRAQLAAASPGVVVVAGAAEAIPLADASVDAVVAGQAWHWFDRGRALPEIARVLRPGGTLAAIWNDPDDRVQWTVQFGQIIDGTPLGQPLSDFGDRFSPAELDEFEHDIWLTGPDLLGMATTRSPYLVADEAGRVELLDAVRGLIADAELGERFPMSFITRVHRARRL